MEHVGIIPVSGAGKLPKAIEGRVGDDGSCRCLSAVVNRIHVWVDVIRCAPELPDVLAAPSPCAITKVGHTQNHWASGFADGIAVDSVVIAAQAFVGFGEAGIELEVVNAPARKGVNVNGFVLVATGEALAGFDATVFVNAEF